MDPDRYQMRDIKRRLARIEDAHNRILVRHRTLSSAVNLVQIRVLGLERDLDKGEEE